MMDPGKQQDDSKMKSSFDVSILDAIKQQRQVKKVF